MDDKKSANVDLFAAETTYPDPAAVFTFRPKRLRELKESALVIIDANALLLPYRTGSESLAAIRTVFRKLIDEKRLVVPAQVAREFAANRPRTLGELFEQIDTRFMTPPSGKEYPLFEQMREYQTVRKLEGEIRKTISQHSEAVKALRAAVRGWYWDDPVSDLYRELFSADVVVETRLDRAEFASELARRNANRVPPGYKDASKENGGAGDLLVWRTILDVGRERNSDAILVSADEKSDWWHRSTTTGIYPRYELVEEYRQASNGGTFHICRLGSLLEMMGASAEAVEQVTVQEAVSAQVLTAQTLEYIQEAVLRWLRQSAFAVKTDRAGNIEVTVGTQTRTVTIAPITNVSGDLKRIRKRWESLSAEDRKQYLVFVVPPGLAQEWETSAQTFISRWNAILRSTVVIHGRLQEGEFVFLGRLWPPDEAVRPQPS